jgi:hypothetical protein
MRHEYCGKNPPSKATIREWMGKFLAPGSALQRKGTGRSSFSEESVDRVRQVCLLRTKKFTRQMS